MKGGPMACIRKRRDRWIIDFYDNQGRRRWKTLPKGNTKKKAKEKLREIEDRLGKGTWMPEKRIPIFSMVYEDWLEFKKPNVRYSTLRKYKGYLKNHFQDFEQTRINRLTIASMEKFISKKQTENMSLVTLRKLIIVLNQVMKYSIRHRYIDFNPVRDVERPRDNGEIEKTKIRVLDTSEINALLEATRGQKYKTLFMLALMSGARQGELFGLKWTDIDWHNNQMRIKRTFNEGAFHKPKSKASMRKIDLGPTMMKTLKEWKLACLPNEHGLVFSSRNGKPLLHYNVLRRHFLPALEGADLPRIRFHDMRHTFASHLIEQGESIVYISNQLGHSKVSTTLDIYGHLIKTDNYESACRLETKIFQTGSIRVAENKKEACQLSITP
jgi:integrase